MNSLRKKDLEDLKHKYNMNTVTGMSSNISDLIMPYLDNLYRAFTEKIQVGLVYSGYKILSPWEYANMITKGNPNNRRYDIIETSHIHVRLHLEYNGEEVPNTIISIPYIKRDGLICLSGTDYNVVPVLSDTLVSPTNEGVLLSVLISKINLFNISRPFLKNNNIELGSIVTSNIVRPPTSNNLGTGVVNPMYSYIFAITGVREHFNNVTGKEIFIDTMDNIGLYKDHDIYSNVQSKPIGLFTKEYVPSNIIIAVVKDGANTEGEDLIYSLLYMMSILPDVAIPLMNIINSHDREREKMFIYYVMARLIYLDTYETGAGTTLVMEHMDSLERYVDPITIGRAEEIGLDVSSPVKLFTELVNNFKSWFIQGKGYSSNLEQRYIEILYYLLYDYVVGMNRVLIDIDKNKGTKLAMNRVKRLFNSNLSSKVIYSLTSGGVNICLRYIDTVGDNAYVRNNSILELRERAAGVKSGKGQHFPSSIRKVVPLDIILGTLNNLPKKSPSPRVSLNPYAVFDKTGRVVVRTEDRKMVELMGTLLSGRNSTDVSRDIMMLMYNSSDDAAIEVE